jgi:ribonuclease D
VCPDATYTRGLVTPSWIRSAEDLQRVAPSLRGAALALDSESDSLHHHREKVCLLQLASEDGAVWLVDTLAFHDLSALAPVLADPGVVKVLHGADYDVTTLKRDFGFQFTSLFDTGIAARFLGFPEVGLQAVLLRELGVAVTKESQTADWSRRPLPPAQEAYAAGDVLHLIPLWRRLVPQLQAVGRLSWVLEECDAVAALEAARRGRDPEAWQKVKNVRKLSRRQQAALRELWMWRDGVAEATDVPAFKLASTEAMVELATKPPSSAAEAAATRGLSPRVRAQGGEILAAVQRAAALPEGALPVLPVSPRVVVPEEQKKRTDLLRAWRTAEAARLGLDISVVLPNRLIEKLAEVGPRSTAQLQDVPGLRRWRIETFGDDWLRLLK